MRFKNLTVEADCFVGERALPTLPNAARNLAEMALSCFGVKLAERTNLHILKDISGIISPSRCVFSVFMYINIYTYCVRTLKQKLKWKCTNFHLLMNRMTLLLGPPSCGKTTLLSALAGRLSPSLKVCWITYIYKLHGFLN